MVGSRRSIDGVGCGRWSRCRGVFGGEGRDFGVFGDGELDGSIEEGLGGRIERG